MVTRANADDAVIEAFINKESAWQSGKAMAVLRDRGLVESLRLGDVRPVEHVASSLGLRLSLSPSPLSVLAGRCPATLVRCVFKLTATDWTRARC
jgi:hypothetical protein